MATSAHPRRRSGRLRNGGEPSASAKVTIAYVAKLLAFTGLAPDIVMAILDGRQPRGLSANRMLQTVPEVWDEQRRLWEFTDKR